MKRTLRMFKWTAVILGSGVLFQFGNCGAAWANTGLAAFDFCALLGENCTFGPIGFCGNPNIAGDEILVDCPEFAITPP
jgi:hypothetical protein